jgi:urease accessory protein
MSLATLRLLQLCSANLPTGAYAFSQGLETATEEGWLNTMDDVAQWLEIQLQHVLAASDLPLLIRLMSAFSEADHAAQQHWNSFALALRETHELRLTDVATGQALMRVLRGLNAGSIDHVLATQAEVSFVSAFALAAAQWNIGENDACLGYAWSWLENQVAAATKLVPLGQTQSQQLLELLQPKILLAIDHAFNCNDDDIGASLPALAIASCWHEHQYSRLFRS